MSNINVVINDSSGYIDSNQYGNSSKISSINNSNITNGGVKGTDYWNKYYGSNLGSGTIVEELDLYEEATSSANVQLSNNFTDTYNAFQETINKLKVNYENEVNNTNVTLDSKYSFITSLETYNIVIGNGSATEEIFVYNTETGKYEKTTIEQWVSYIINGAYFDFSVLDSNSPIQKVYLEDGEETYNVDYKKLKEYYDNLNKETGLYIIDSNIEQYNIMIEDYDNLLSLYQQYNLFAPYMADYITSQIVSDAGRRYQNMSDEQLNNELNELLKSVNIEIQCDIYNLGLKYDDLLDTMTRDQKIAFILTNRNENIESASKYLDMIKDTLVQTKAMNNVQKRLKHYIDSETGVLDLETLQEDIENGDLELDEDLGTFLLSGGYGFIDGVANFVNGYDYSNLGQTDVGEYTRMYFAMAIANSAISNANYTLGTSIGQMAPVVIMSYALRGAGVSSGIVSIITGVANAGSIFGGTLDTSIQNGEDVEKAITYSVLTAIVSSGSEYFLGGLPGLSKGANNVDSLAKLLKNMLNEGVQEGYEELIDAGLRKVIFNEPIDITELSRDAFLSIVYGGLTAGFYSELDLNITLVTEGKSQGYTMTELQAVAEYMLKYPTATINMALSEVENVNSLMYQLGKSQVLRRKYITDAVYNIEDIDYYAEDYSENNDEKEIIIEMLNDGCHIDLLRELQIYFDSMYEVKEIFYVIKEVDCDIEDAIKINEIYKYFDETLNLKICAEIYENLVMFENKYNYNILDKINSKKFPIVPGMEMFLSNVLIPKMLVQRFPEYVTEEKIKKLENSIELLSDSVYKKRYPGHKDSLGINNGKISSINVNQKNFILTAIHESLHCITRNEKNPIIVGIQLMDVNGNVLNRGLNEAITDYLAGEVAHTGYNDGYVEACKKIDEMIYDGLLDVDSVIKAYFENDSSILEREITSLTGDPTYFEKMSKSFDKATSKNPVENKEGINEIEGYIEELFQMKELGVN